MQTRVLGNTGLEFTTIGLGTWAMGGGDWLFGWGPQDEREAIEAVKRAIELGINWIDTAAVYGIGRSEELVGRALKELGSAKRPLVATKCSRIRAEDGSIGGNLKRDSIFREVEDSLRRLGIDVIDLYQLHRPVPDEDIEEGWATLADLRKRGKVRHIGVSNFDVEQMKRIESIHPIGSLQPNYSMLVRNIENDVLDFCREQNIGVIAYSPMCKGLLTGAFTRERAETLGDDDHRSRDPQFKTPQLKINLDFVASLRAIAQRAGRSLAELAIAWVLRRPEVTAAIVGTRRPAQIEDTVAAANWTLSEEDIAEIEQLLQKRENALDTVT